MVECDSVEVWMARGEYQVLNWREGHGREVETLVVECGKERVWLMKVELRVVELPA